ncbi:AraC family transcriptional regulator [Rhizobium sp. AP16]|uniref:AraC family transcriptional regulator n=1 Tax=Rhizobium sp. AP16 TaxID=1144306 RepID=UPI00026EDCA2|nr:helix-turn-helix domain-containing protein [Rhizobium sp. AP16]EJK78890.1 transcriptional regulator containing an amidase domain and an AraC-type DNA-binding HTH domain [Rhizobium sp. AP16]
MRYASQSVFKIVKADADEMSEHYARTLSPAKVEPLRQHSLISVEDRHFSVGRYSVWNGRCQSGMQVTLSQAPDAYALYLPSSGVMEIDAGSKRLISKPTTALLGDMSCFERLTLHEGRSHMGVAFEKSAMIQQLSELLDAPVIGGIDFADTIDLATAKGARVAALSHLVWSCLNVEETDRPSSAFVERLLQAMMIALLETVPNNYSARLTKPVSPAIPKRLKRAIEYMHSNISSPMGVADIAREAGTSVRALQAAFQQFKDTTPLNYLRTIRLDGARKTLTDPAISLSVAEVARNWGFSHMGRFAALYHQSFGEMPSSTAKMGRGGAK